MRCLGGCSHMLEEPLIKVEAVEYVYPSGVKAVNGVDLEIRRGEFVALMGQNGSGKTTLAKLMNGLLKPTSGRVLLKGRDTREMTAAECARVVGYVFQNPEHQIFAPTLYDEVAFGPRNLGIPEDEVRRRVEEALEIMDLKKPMDSLPHLFSVGEKHRVAIASVLAMNPEVIILDEPTTGIDYGRSLQIMRALKKLKEKGETIVLITHDMYLAAEFAERVVILRNGVKVADGPVEEILSDRDTLSSNGLQPLQVTVLSEALSRYGIIPGLVRCNDFVQSFINALRERHKA